MPTLLKAFLYVGGLVALDYCLNYLRRRNPEDSQSGSGKRLDMKD